jgi:hypothetical protein
MSFWDLAQTAATIAAGAYGGPAVGAAVGGGLSAVRGKDPLMGAVSGYMGGMGGEGMTAAANQTALKAGTNVATVNAANAAAAGLTGTNAMVPTMTGFGGSAAGTGITTGMNTGLNNVYSANLPGGIKGAGFSPYTPAAEVSTMPPYMNTSKTIDTTNYYDTPTATRGTVLDNTTSSYFNPELPPLEASSQDFTNTNNFKPINTTRGADMSSTVDVPIAEQYDFSETIRRPGEIPDGGFSLSEQFDAVTNNPRDFLKNYGDGNELYGAGKVGLTGLGMYASAMEPENGYGYEDMKISGDDVRNRGPQGQLNLAGLPSLNVNNPYGYAEGGYLSGGNVPGDGMSDSIPAMIGRGQQAALSEGEFVIPADVVSHLGNGSSNAGSKQLYAMMDQVRKDRTGTAKQGKEINPERYMPA